MKTLFLAIISLCALPAFAAELHVKPGLWESTTTRTSSMGGGTFTDKNRECIKEKVFSPEDMMKDMESCKQVKNELQDKHTLLFGMVCSSQGGKASVEGKYYTKGDEGKGDMKIQVDMGGMKMNMDLTWDAKRVGDC